MIIVEGEGVVFNVLGKMIDFFGFLCVYVEGLDDFLVELVD